MTIAPDDTAFQWRASRSDVAHLLHTAEAPTVVAWLEAIGNRARADPTGMYRVGLEYAPYAGSADVVWLDGLGSVHSEPKGATGVTARGTPTVAAALPGEPEEAAFEPGAVSGQQAPARTGRPFQDGFELVATTDLRGRAVPHAIAMARFARLANITKGSNPRTDICETLTFLTTFFGVTADTLRDWCKPGGPLAGRYALRNYSEGGHITYSQAGELMWRFDILNRPAKAGQGSAYVKVPHTWLYAHPSATDGNQWVGGIQVKEIRTINGHEVTRVEWRPAAYTKGAVYAAIVVRALTFGGRTPSVADLSNWTPLKPRRFADLLREAEDAGLIATYGSRSGRVAAQRSAHTIPLVGDARTVATRRKAYKGTSTDLPADHQVLDYTVEPPF